MTSQNGQPVFASSSASKGKGAGSTAAAGSPSQSSALGDAWSGFGSQASASGSRAPVASLGQGGASASTVGMAILALGLVGALGTFLVLASPRRRRATVDPEGTTSRARGESSVR